MSFEGEGEGEGESRKRKRGFQSRSRDARALKRSTIDQHIADLDRRTAEFDPANIPAPAPAAQPPNKKQKKSQHDQQQQQQQQQRGITQFKQLPLSNPTAQGLRKASYTTCTPIQTRAIPLALRGKDVLAAAPTGSGKTLAFLIPVLDVLFRKRWGPADGLGALIISPTRELAIQIFTVLRNIGSAHTFSAGLVIGGKDLHTEQERLARINILVATPGRLLQHMDQTVDFDTSNVQILVLDEADRILDMGFAPTLNAIVENLPKKRQTLLFSATQTRRVKDLARLSLVEPEYVAVSNAPSDPSDPNSTNAATTATGEDDVTMGASSLPANLSQNYMVVPLPAKLSTLFSFLRTHTQSKTIIFLSSCRQVQFAHSTFCKLRPGVSLLCLHGKQKQAKRLQIFEEFRKTRHAVLFATDIAARGLDFPAVDWVIQLDAPEDAATYVHRVGRTARYQSKGNALLFACPSEEEGLLAMLGAKGIEPNKIKPKESKLQSIDNQLQSFCFQETELKYLAQKAFVSYVRSIHLQRDKATYDVLAYPLEEYAASLGLPGAPKVKFIKEVKKAREKAARKEKATAATATTTADVADDEDDDDEAEVGKDGKVRTKYDRMFGRKNQGVLSEHYAKLVADDAESSASDSGSDDDSDGEAMAEDGFGHEADLLEGVSSKVAQQADDDDDDDDDDDENDFLTLKRADHALSDDDEAGPTFASSVLLQPDGTVSTTSADKLALARAHLPLAEAHLSKRKLLQGSSKKAMAAAGLRGSGDKLIFDDEGNARSAYAITSEETFLGTVAEREGGIADEIRRFGEEEREALRERDVLDKERVREKRREKKRREKERAKGEVEGGSSDEDGEEGGEVVFEPPEDLREDGYETPDFGLDEEDDEDDDDDDDDDEEEEEEVEEVPIVQQTKKTQRKKQGTKAVGTNKATTSTLTDEELALRLLSGTA